MKKAQIGMVGLAVMGENLAMNMESHGFTVAVYDVRPGVVEHFMQGRGAGKGFIGAHSWQELADSLQPPRKVMLMIRAGEPVDQVIAQLLPVLAAGDTITCRGLGKCVLDSVGAPTKKGRLPVDIRRYI